MKLTKEQQDYLKLLGKPDDGRQTYIVADAERITDELVRLGLVHSTGPGAYDLTDEGERLYGELTGENIS
jgi:hypothetical protein